MPFEYKSMDGTFPIHFPAGSPEARSRKHSAVLKEEHTCSERRSTAWLAKKFPRPIVLFRWETNINSVQSEIRLSFPNGEDLNLNAWIDPFAGMPNGRKRCSTQLPLIGHGHSSALVHIVWVYVESRGSFWPRTVYNWTKNWMISFFSNIMMNKKWLSK